MGDTASPARAAGQGPAPGVPAPPAPWGASAGPVGRAGAPGTAGWRTGARRGTVEAFDEPRGVGTVRADDGRVLPFHCTALLDGTRAVTPGTAVSFTVAAGHGGTLQAVGISVTP